MTADIIFVIRNSELQGNTVNSLRAELRKLVAPGRRLVLHMAGVDCVDTKGAGAILEIARKLNQSGGSIRLVGLKKTVLAFFELLQMHRSIELYGIQHETTAMTAMAA